MSNKTAEMTRLMRATDAVLEELDRQGVSEVLANLNFDPMQMAQAVITAVDDDVVPAPDGPRGH
jgi:hypothetical protein